MICVSVLYPNAPGTRFDHEYYAESHLPMVMNRCRDFGMTRYEIDRGLAGGAPGAPAPFVAGCRLYFQAVEGFQNAMAAHGAEILGDIPNYTDIEIQLQVSDLASGS